MQLHRSGVRPARTVLVTFAKTKVTRQRRKPWILVLKLLGFGMEPPEAGSLDPRLRGEDDQSGSLFIAVAVAVASTLTYLALSEHAEQRSGHWP